MQISVAQIILNVDGKPHFVPLDEYQKSLALSLLAAVFEDGRIKAVPLPDEYQLEILKP